jgi:hypothetical protein
MKSISRRSATALIAAGVVLAPTVKAGAQAQLPGGAPDVLALLEREHRAALRLLDRMVDADDGDDRGRLLRQLADALTIHNANEENIVYPAIRDIANRPSDEETLYHQQDDAKVFLARLVQMPRNDPSFLDGVRNLRAVLSDHIRREEQVDFPALRAALGPRIVRLNELTARLRAHWITDPSA